MKKITKDKIIDSIDNVYNVLNDFRKVKEPNLEQLKNNLKKQKELIQKWIADNDSPSVSACGLTSLLGNFIAEFINYYVELNSTRKILKDLNGNVDDPDDDNPLDSPDNFPQRKEEILEKLASL